MHFNEIDLTKINFQNETITNFEILTQIMPLLSLKYKTKRFMDTDDYATSNNVLEIQDGKYIRGIMEKGVGGVVLETDDPGEISKVVNIVKDVDQETYELIELEIEDVKIASESLVSSDGRNRDVSTIDISIKRTAA